MPWSNVWSASTGIDLFTRGAELVRASVEAGLLAKAHGPDHSFVGYQQAIGPLDFSYGDPRLRNKNFGYATEGFDPSVPEFSVIYYRLTELRSDASSIDAKVCSYGLTPYPSEAGKYLFRAVFVTLEKAANASAGTSGVKDSGTYATGEKGRAPTWNVFAPWSITQLRSVEAQEIPASCAAWWGSVFPDAVKSSTSNQMVRPSGGPIAPDVPQYPRWIGPSDTE
ncbi:hypothetical protein [Williamsia deligens]|uniref:Uncharacterized protein n=1 Tax=Williamsia deligens TaxID=321325 RepID=A0ABW3G7P7_9NOCA|nr:hypothetical protein [Williamsia deligens]